MDIKPGADPMKNLQECIGRYGVQCSETKELAPSIELVNAFADVQSAIIKARARAREEGRREGRREAAEIRKEKERNAAILAEAVRNDGIVLDFQLFKEHQTFKLRKIIPRISDCKNLQLFCSDLVLECLNEINSAIKEQAKCS